MNITQNTADIRPLTEAELADVSGGYLAPLLVGLAAGLTAIAIGVDLPFGMSVKQAAARAGMSHLL